MSRLSLQTQNSTLTGLTPEVSFGGGIKLAQKCRCSTMETISLQSQISKELGLTLELDFLGTLTVQSQTSQYITFGKILFYNTVTKQMQVEYCSELFNNILHTVSLLQCSIRKYSWSTYQKDNINKQIKIIFLKFSNSVTLFEEFN